MNFNYKKVNPEKNLLIENNGNLNEYRLRICKYFSSFITLSSDNMIWEFINESITRMNYVTFLLFIPIIELHSSLYIK